MRLQEEPPSIFRRGDITRTTLPPKQDYPIGVMEQSPFPTLSLYQLIQVQAHLRLASMFQQEQKI